MNSMLDTIFNSGVAAANNLTLPIEILTMVIAFVLGLIISCTYIFTSKKGQYNQSFCYTLIMVPVVVAIVILLIGSNVASAFGLSGAFALVRFRSDTINTKNVAYIFFSVAAGLACGVQVYSYAFILTVVLCIIMIVLTRLNFGAGSTTNKLLKINVPESLNFDKIFDEVLSQYTHKFELIKIQSVDLGSMYQLEYRIVIDNKTNVKEFIDDLRCRNGNMNITLMLDVQQDAV